jgi:hypothetical protein
MTKKLEWTLTTLCDRDEFMYAQIHTMGLIIGEGTVIWISLVSKEGMTNCTHCLT